MTKYGAVSGTGASWPPALSTLQNKVIHILFIFLIGRYFLTEIGHFYVIYAGNESGVKDFTRVAVRLGV